MINQDKLKEALVKYKNDFEKFTPETQDYFKKDLNGRHLKITRIIGILMRMIFMQCLLLQQKTQMNCSLQDSFFHEK